MISDRREKGYRTGQIKGKDYLFVTGVVGMGGGGSGNLSTAFRYMWWAIPAHRLAVLNTKLEIMNESFELYDKYLLEVNDIQTKQPYRVLISSKPPVNDTVDYSAVTSNVYIPAGTGKGRVWRLSESDLPQPISSNYNGKIYVIIDMISNRKAPEDADFGMLYNKPNYEAMRTKVYDYEARL